jgi:hypothetical protein
LPRASVKAIVEAMRTRTVVSSTVSTLPARMFALPMNSAASTSCVKAVPSAISLLAIMREGATPERVYCTTFPSIFFISSKAGSSPRNCTMEASAT